MTITGINCTRHSKETAAYKSISVHYKHYILHSAWSKNLQNCLKLHSDQTFYMISVWAPFESAQRKTKKESTIVFKSLVTSLDHTRTACGYSVAKHTVFCCCSPHLLSMGHSYSPAAWGSVAAFLDDQVVSVRVVPSGLRLQPAATPTSGKMR